MKTKQIELIVLTLAALLILGYSLVYFSGGFEDTETALLMTRILASGLAIYVGYVYITQLRDRRRIDGLLERNDELKHKVADKEHQIEKLNKDVSKLTSDLEAEKANSDKLSKAHAKAQKEWKAEKAQLEEQLKEASAK